MNHEANLPMIFADALHQCRSNMLQDVNMLTNGMRKKSVLEGHWDPFAG